MAIGCSENHHLSFLFTAVCMALAYEDFWKLYRLAVLANFELSEESKNLHHIANEGIKKTSENPVSTRLIESSVY